MSAPLEFRQDSGLDTLLPDHTIPGEMMCRYSIDGWVLKLGQIRYWTESPERLAAIRDAITRALDEYEEGVRAA